MSTEQNHSMRLGQRPPDDDGAPSWGSGLRRRLMLLLALVVGVGIGILLADSSPPPGAPPAHLALAPPDAPVSPLPSVAPTPPPPTASPPPPPSVAPPTPPPAIASPSPPPNSASRAQPPPAATPALPRPSGTPPAQPPSAAPVTPATPSLTIVPPLPAPAAPPPAASSPAAPTAPPPPEIARQSPPPAGSSPTAPTAPPPPQIARQSPLPAPDAGQPTVPRRVAPAPADGMPAWRRNAIAVPNVAGKAMIAMVIDDMGVDQRRSAEIVRLPGPLTLAFLPYGRELPRQTAAARAQGHELLVHVSMEPLNPNIKPGPNALTVDLPEDEIRRRLDWALAAFDGYVGINNHMGSRFTSERPGMEVVMAELQARGLLFLDSRTVQRSLGATVAAAHGVPHAGRHFFIDNELSIVEINRELAETERVARQTGLAVAIGHPHDVTIAALAAWLPTLEEKGFVLVPISAVVERLEARRGASQQSAAPRDATPGAN